MTNRIIRGHNWFGVIVAALVVLYGAFVAITKVGDPDADIGFGYILGILSADQVKKPPGALSRRLVLRPAESIESASSRAFMIVDSPRADATGTSQHG